MKAVQLIRLSRILLIDVFLLLQISALILENTFTSVLDMAGVMLPLLKYVIGGTGSPGLRMLNFLVRSPWSTIDIVSKVSMPISEPETKSSVTDISVVHKECDKDSHRAMLFQDGSLDTCFAVFSSLFTYSISLHLHVHLL